MILEILDSDSSLVTGGYGRLREITEYSDSRAILEILEILEILDSDSSLVTGGYGRFWEVTGRYGRLRAVSRSSDFCDSRDSKLRF